MTIAQKLKEVAEKIVSNAETKSINLERNPPSHKAPTDELKVYNAEREAVAKALSRIHGRLPYIVKGTTEYNCPKCWFLGDARSIINPRQVGGTKNDYWGCDTCGFEVEVVRGI
jgi:hypothetical protein